MEDDYLSLGSEPTFTMEGESGAAAHLEKGLNPDLSTDRALWLVETVEMVYTPFLFIFGTVGNCLSIIVFFSKSHHQTRGSLSSSVYLSALAISDSGFLINLMMIWLDNRGIGVLSSSFLCKSVMYVGQVAGFLSVWFIVAFTVERFFVVCYPLFRPSKCTASRAKRIAFGLTGFTLLLFSYVWIIAKVLPIGEETEQVVFNDTLNEHDAYDRLSQQTINPLIEDVDRFGEQKPGASPSSLIIHGDAWDRTTSIPIFDDAPLSSGKIRKNGSRTEIELRCIVPPEYNSIASMTSNLDTILTFFVPFILISILNLKIICCVRQIQGHRKSMLANSSGRSRLCHHQQQDPHSNISGTKCNNGLSDLFTTFRSMKSSAGAGTPRQGISDYTTYTFVKPASSVTGSSNSNKYQGRLERPQNNEEARGCEENNLIINNQIDSESEESEGDDSNPSPGEGEVNPPCFSRNVSVSASKETTTEATVTRTLLLVSFVFIALHLPAHCIRMVSHFKTLDRKTAKKLFVAQHAANLLFNTNFAINFLLYCCSGRAFRHSVRNLFFQDGLFRWRKHKRHASSTGMTTHLTIHTDPLSSKYSTRVVHSQKLPCPTLDQEDQV